MVTSILKISITQNTNCDNMVSFPKSGHIYVYKTLFENQAQKLANAWSLKKSLVVLVALCA